MTLEEEVKKLMEEPIEASAPMLEYLTAQREPDARSLDLEALIRIVAAQGVGLKRAVLRIAREIDEMRDV